MTSPHISLFVAVIAALPAHAQDRTPQPAPQETADSEGEGDAPDIVVTGQRERGSVPGDIQPEIQLRAGDIRSYGVSSVSELLTELAPQTGGGRGGAGGMPVVLLNGRRISGFGEIRDIPTEAIERVDILPEEAALRLGYRADQRVVNFVLRRRFNAITGEVQGGGSTQGDRYSAAADANLLRIQRDRRLTVNLHYDGATPVYESDRDIAPTGLGRTLSIPGIVTPGAGLTLIDPSLPVAAAGVPDGASGRPAIGSFVVPPVTSAVGAYRTLSAATRTLSTNATYSRPILGNITAALNTSFQASVTDSDLGLGTGSFAIPASNPYSPFAGPVTLNRYLVEGGARDRQVDANVGHVGLALNGDLGEWRWSTTAAYDRNFSRTWTDQSFDTSGIAARIAAGDPAINPFALLPAGVLGDFRRDYARSITNSIDYDFVISGPVATLPAGKIATTTKLGFDSDRFDARARRSAVLTTSSLGRDTASGQISVDVPIASRRTGFLDAIGNLSLNGNYAADRASDFGTLTTLGYGATWSPVEPVRLIASVSDQDVAPQVAQLGNPLIVTQDVRIFDFVTGNSVNVTQIAGGNRSLLAEDRRTTKLNLTLRPLKSNDLTLTANYLRTRVLNPISSLPAPTAEIEAAFPGAFVRDGAGQLLRVDNRPVNFARRDQEELRWGINLSKRIGAPPPRPAGGFGQRFRQQQPQQQQPSSAAPPSPAGDTPADTTAQPAPPPAQDRPAGGFGGRGPGGFGGGGFGGRGGFGGGFGGTRLQASIYHTWHFRDRLLIRPGVPVIDLLDGGTLGSRGGQPEHEVSVDAGVTRNWLGVRVSGRWQSGTSVRGGTALAPTDLDFAPLTTVSLRTFANFTPNLMVVRDHPWLRGTRVTFSIQNVFNQKLRVTDPSGATPVNYQPDLLDPIGRTWRIGVRKLFF